MRHQTLTILATGTILATSVVAQPILPPAEVEARENAEQKIKDVLPSPTFWKKSSGPSAEDNGKEKREIEYKRAPVPDFKQKPDHPTAMGSLDERDPSADDSPEEYLKKLAEYIARRADDEEDVEKRGVGKDLESALASVMEVLPGAEGQYVPRDVHRRGTDEKDVEKRGFWKNLESDVASVMEYAPGGHGGVPRDVGEEVTEDAAVLDKRGFFTDIAEDLGYVPGGGAVPRQVNEEVTEDAAAVETRDTHFWTGGAGPCCVM
ncbi:hypothetical protein MMC10_008840 [Thelotrema lepadinum]|nr:hypothetical protein [Thelotrema lepadinum]